MSIEVVSDTALLPCPWCPPEHAPVFRWCGGVMLVECARCGVSKGDGGFALNEREDMTAEEFDAAIKASASERWNHRSLTASAVGSADAVDAGRYRWLRASGYDIADIVAIFVSRGMFMTDEGFDTAIDAAMAAQLATTSATSERGGV